MSILCENKNDTNDLKLQEDLERRFGPAMAQDIMDQLKKAENGGQNGPADYMDAKALSEGTELYRRETQAALKRLKSLKHHSGVKAPGIIDWDEAFLQKQMEKSLGFYLRFNKGYFILYRQTMDAYKIVGTNPYKEQTHLYGMAA